MLVKIELSNRLAQIVSALLNLSNNQGRNRLSFSRLGLRDHFLMPERFSFAAPQWRKLAR